MFLLYPLWGFGETARQELRPCTRKASPVIPLAFATGSPERVLCRSNKYQMQSDSPDTCVRLMMRLFHRWVNGLPEGLGFPRFYC